MGLATWPVPTRLGTGLAAGVGAALFQAAAISRTTSRAIAIAAADLLANFDQHLPGADGQFSHRAAWPKRQVGVRQQNLQRQQRSLQFTMNEPYRAAGEFDFLERPLRRAAGLNFPAAR